MSGCGSYEVSNDRIYDGRGSILVSTLAAAVVVVGGVEVLVSAAGITAAAEEAPVSVALFVEFQSLTPKTPS